MNELLILAFIASLKITLIHAVMTWEGMLFTHVGRQLSSSLPWFIHKPLFSCQLCMTSIWGITFFILDTQGQSGKDFVDFILMVGGISALLSCLIGPRQLLNELHGD